MGRLNHSPPAVGRFLGLGKQSGIQQRTERKRADARGGATKKSAAIYQKGIIHRSLKKGRIALGGKPLMGKLRVNFA